jgi:ABC-type transport system substrate-binding protein
VPKHELDDADPKTLIEDTFSNTPVTSGAFSFNALQSAAGGNEKVYYLSANPNYYKGRALLDSFAVHTYKDKDSVVSALNSGAVTATAELSGPDADKIVAGQFIKRNSSLNSGAYIFFNTASEIVKNKDLRTAIRQGINLEEIRAAAPDTTALNYPLLDSQIDLSGYPEIPGQDREAAKATIADSLGDSAMGLEIATINAGYLPAVADKLAEQLRDLGFEVNVSKYEENQEFISNIISKRSYSILVYDTELGADPDLLPYYHSSQTTASGLNLSNYRNALVDDLLLGARDTLDEALRAKKYEAFLRYWVNDVPAIGLYQPNLTYIYNRNVRTFSDNVRLVTELDRFTDITDWAAVKETKNKTP